MTQRGPNWDVIVLTATGVVCGIILGAGFGFVAAHHFPFWGGIMMIGQPYSQARWSLVPGHALAFSIVPALVFGMLGHWAGRHISR